MTRATPRRHARLSGEAGVGLVEVLVAMIILSTAIVALIGGIGTSIIATDAQRKGVTADGVLRSWVEELQRAPYVACAGPSAAGYQPAAVGVAVPANFTARITAIDFWDGSQTAGYVPPPCPPTADNGLQRITMSVRSTDGRAAARIQILKRQP